MHERTIMSVSRVRDGVTCFFSMRKRIVTRCFCMHERKVMSDSRVWDGVTCFFIKRSVKCCSGGTRTTVPLVLLQLTCQNLIANRTTLLKGVIDSIRESVTKKI